MAFVVLVGRGGVVTVVVVVVIATTTAAATCVAAAAATTYGHLVVCFYCKPVVFVYELHFIPLPFPTFVLCIRFVGVCVCVCPCLL